MSSKDPSKSPESTHPFDPDLSLIDPKDDVLGRADFAKEIAQHLTSWKGKESLVLSITGEWGSGKSTVKNFIKHYLLLEQEKPILVEFTPWQWSASDKIFDAFFKEIGIAIGKSDKHSEYKALAKRWIKLGSYFQLASPILKPFEKLSGILFGSAAISSLATLSGLPVPAWTLWVSIPIALLAGVATFSVTAATALTKFYKTQTELSAKSQEDTHNELKDAMSELKMPVIVFLDDLDRLSSAELRTTVQLIKANCQLPNLIYVTFYEQKIVEQALSEVIEKQGDRYLQKIVQHPFSLPQASKANLRKYLTDQLNEILSSNDSKGVMLNRDRWQNDIGRLLIDWFTNLREIKRYIGSIRFLVARHSNTGYFEVDFIDLITLEAIRLKNTDVYEQIARGFHYNENLESLFSGPDTLDKAFKQNVESIVDSLGASHRDKATIHQLIHQLFPQSRENANYSDGMTKEWLKGKRICHEKHFSKYFQLRLGESDISSLTLSSIMSSEATREEIKALFLQHDKAGNINDLLEALRAQSEDFPPSNLLNVMVALFDSVDEFTDNSHLNFLYDSELLAFWLLAKLLEILPSHDSDSVFLDALDSSNGLILPMRFVSSELEANNKQQDDLKLSETTTLKAQSKLLEKIRNKSRDKSLLETRRAYAAIFTWQNWTSNPEEVKEWTSSVIEQGNGVKLIALILSRTDSSHYGIQYWLAGESAEKVIDLESLNLATKDVDLTALAEKESLAIQLLREAIHRKLQGQPYREIHKEDITDYH